MERGALRTVAMAVAATAALVTGGTAEASTLFSPTGPWNAPVPANPTLDSNSGVIVSTLANKIAVKKALGAGPPFISTASGSIPLYRVRAGAAKKPIVVDQVNGRQAGLQGAIDGNGGVPFPDDARPANGNQNDITVYDTDNHVIYEFWHATKPSQNSDGNWHALAGGIMDHVDTKLGFFSTDAWTGLPDGQGLDWGVSAAKLPLDAGLITIPELQAGVIDHALSAAWETTCTSYFMYPAQNTDGQDASPACLPEGAKLQLDPAYNVKDDSNPPIVKAIEGAAQTYGIIIRDQTTAGNNFNFYGEDPITPEHPNPYTSGPGVGGVDNGGKGFFGTVPSGELLANFPWSRLRVIASAHCTHAPCGSG